MYRDRTEAAFQLVEALRTYQGKNPLIRAIPRGAVPMGRILADELQGQLDVVLTRKLRAPGNPELAIGSIDESGRAYLTDFAAELGVTAEYIEAEKQAQLDVIEKRRAQYTPVRAPIDPADRIVIVIDDGLATGATMIAALHSVRAKRPRELVCAVPVAPRDTLAKIEPLADEVVCLMIPSGFFAVAQFYRNFSQVSDEEVVEALAGSL
jgi:putative phosphoribosyl transferase